MTPISDFIQQHNMVSIAPTVTITATPDYSAGDCVGGIVTVSSAVNTKSNRPIRLTNVTLTDNAGQAPALSLLFFRATPAGGTYTDNSALVLDASDIADLVGVVRIAAADWYTVSSKSLVAVNDLNMIMDITTTSLFMLVVADGAYNAGATTDLTVKLGVDQF